MTAPTQRSSNPPRCASRHGRCWRCRCRTTIAEPMAGEEAPPRTDEKIALVLGAGGARGFAQIGVIEALEARRMNVVAVSGSSSGALVGGIYAAGKLREFREELEIGRAHV